MPKILSSLCLIAVLLLSGFSGIAQDNQLDDQGKKTGYWVVTGEMSGKQGYAPDAIYEEGEYKKSRKTGIWKRYWPNAKLKSEINYVNGRASGTFITYYENGNVEESGNMVGGNLTGAWELNYPDGTPKQRKNFNESGETEGTVEYYHPNGQLELTFETTNGKETGKATWFYANGNVKKEKTFVNGEADASLTKEYERVDPPYNDPNAEPIKKGPKIEGDFNGATGGLVDNYGKTYDKDKNILMDGEFKDGRLYNGRHYIYDEFGLLDHIEVYKEGEFAGNGVIGAKDKY